MSQRNRPGNPLSTLAAFLRMDFVEDISYPLSFTFTQATSLTPVVIYYFVDRLVPPERIGGDYFTFALVGLGAATILQASLSGFGGTLQRALDRGTLETYLVEPVRWTFLPFAMNLWRTIVGAITCASVLLAGLVLGAHYQVDGIPAFMALLGMGALATSGVGILSASLLVLAKRAQPIVVLYGLAASLLAGVIFPVSLLPGWLRAVSWFVPHTYVVNASRAVLMEGDIQGAVPFDQAMIVLAGFTVVTFVVGLLALSRALQYGRKLGTLSGY